MLNGGSHLVIVHQYPTSKMHAFLNPVRKKTIEVLPRIAEMKREKSNTPHTRASIKRNAISQIQRPCCIYKDQTKNIRHYNVKKSKKVKLDNILRPSKLQLSQQQNCIGHGNNEIVSAREKNQSQKYLSRKINLPALKQFSQEQICDTESKHKIIRTEASVNLSSPNLYSSQKLKMQSSKCKGSTVQNEDNSIDSSYIKYFDDPPRMNALQIEDKKQRQQQLQAPIAKHKDQYNLKNDYFRKDTLQPKNCHEGFDQSTNSLNTVFHSYKRLRQSVVQRQLQRLKMYSARSNGMFKVPKEDQLQQFILNYPPMNPEFDFKRLVKQTNFQVINSQRKVYFGQVQKDKRHGRGINISERDIYEGVYQNNVKAQGYQKNKDGLFIGKFCKGKRHGMGKFIWKNGEQFEGEWKSGKKDGFGVWKSPKGDYYEGQWKENKQNGKGLYYHCGASKYKGYFKDFLKHGPGQQEFCNGDQYIGDYQYGKPHGNGRYTWKNGDEYEGQFIQGSRQGKGRLQSCGDEYIGQFKNDMKHGLGTETYSSGQTFSGEFKQGKRLHGKLSTKAGSQMQAKLPQ